MMKNKLLWKLAMGVVVLSLTGCVAKEVERTDLQESMVASSVAETVEQRASVDGQTEEQTVEPSADDKQQTLTQEDMDTVEEFTSDEDGSVTEQSTWVDGEEVVPTETTDAGNPIYVQQKELDVDGDGEAEMIYFASNLTSSEYVLSVRERSGDTVFFDDGEQEFTIEDVSLGAIELENGKGIFYIMSSLGSDWGDYCIYGYDKGEIKTLGVLSAYVFGLECDGEQLTTLVSSYTVQSDQVKNHYEIDWKKGSLKYISEEHELQVQYWNNGAFVTDSVKELTLHTQADANSETIVLKPQKIKFTKIDTTENWIYMLGKDGNGGWLEKGENWQQWQEYFENLTFFN